ncbi:neugrin [Takifugu rubripes]|uniref:Neugrin n=1 Tax=Takifugu rubripes TaxID=31033 RepID=H2SAJ2_TAKRU|nr:neugrin [Takifugu rubripes]|eukprot:XP_003963261.2 PREDICTED: neugrin [Takifugu rubripes]
MIRTIKVLPFLSRIRSASVFSPVLTGCRCASRSTNKPWMEQRHVHREMASNRASKYSHEMFNDELEPEDVEDKVQALMNNVRRRQKAVKFHVLRRQMTSPGAPKRKLSWDAIEQIRYLKQEQPEEWTVERLAEGFSVTPDVILRVIRSKFVPTVDRRAEQDAKVMAEHGQKVLHSGSRRLQEKLKLPGNFTPAALPPGKETAAVVPAEQTLVLRGEGPVSLAKSHTPSVQHHSSDFVSNVSETNLTDLDKTTNSDPIEEEECWDGRVFTEDDLEKFIEMQNPPLPVKMGKDFFDTEGNFLYRI